MRNPFEYGGIVSQDAFCNREKEQDDLRRVIDNAGTLFLYAERRMGKTSLVQRVLKHLPSNHHLTVYIDLWPTDDLASFVTAVAKAITEASSTKVDRALDTAKKLFGGLAPGITVDEQGKPVVTFGVRQLSKHTAELEEVLEAPAKIAALGRRKVVIVMDEFQQILAYGSDIVERRLRSVIQHHKEVAYLFLGSRKHLIQQMFVDSSRPLYRSAAHYPLLPIAEEHWQPFIRDRFANADKSIGSEEVQSVYRLTQGHPFYTQHLCHVLWERCETSHAVDQTLIDEAVDILLKRESYAYTALWESLTVNQRRFLQGLATEDESVQPFSSAFVQQYGLKAPSNAQRVANALLARDLIDRDNGSFVVQDRFFRIWIRRM